MSYMFLVLQSLFSIKFQCTWSFRMKKIAFLKDSWPETTLFWKFGPWFMSLEVKRKKIIPKSLIFRDFIFYLQNSEKIKVKSEQFSWEILLNNIIVSYFPHIFIPMDNKGKIKNLTKSINFLKQKLFRNFLSENGEMPLCQKNAFFILEISLWVYFSNKGGALS